MLIARCWCGHAEFGPRTTMHGVEVRACARCGTYHQVVEMTPAELAAFYGRLYAGQHQQAIGAEPYPDRYRRDRKTAATRLAAWEELGWTWDKAHPALDIGAANNALVEELIGEGVVTYGVDLDEATSDAPMRYTGDLADIMFPTEQFSLVTMLDSLEHMVDPAAMLREVFRITRAGGRIIIDIPDFWCPEGEKHWRLIQHLWMWDRAQILDMVEAAGFTDLEHDRPVPGKLVITARKPVIRRMSILLLPGMGDIYWCLAKLQALLAARGQTAEPAIFLWDIDGRRRSDDYVRRVPWVHFAGHISARTDRDFNEVYFDARRWAIPHKLGCDLLMAFNGRLRHGQSLDDAAPDLATNWHFPLHRPLVEREYEMVHTGHPGGHLVVYVSGHGMFETWVKAWGIPGIAEYVSTVAARTGTTPIFTGSSWDASIAQMVADQVPGAINRCGETSLDELFALIRTARGCIGWCGGNTFQAVQLGIPTQIIWSGYFPNAGFYKHACPPVPTYQWAQIERVRPNVAAEAAAKLIGIDMPRVAGMFSRRAT